MRIFGRGLLLFLSLTLTSELLAQEIAVANLSSNKGYFGTTLEISGSGFSTNAANMEVWFGAARANVLESRENILLVEVPAGATTSSVTVRNKTNNLSASSSEIFFPEFLGDPTHDFSITDPYTFASTKETYDVEIVDLDLDGNNDMVVTKKDNTATDIQIFRNTTNGSTISFAETSVNIGVPTLRVKYGDIDNDGKQDILVTQENHYTVYVLRNTSTVGSISFAAPKSYFIRPTQFIRGIDVKDINLDGKPEVLISNTIDDELSIFVNNSTPGTINLSFTPTRLNTGGKNVWDLIAEDFNGDGKADVAIVQGDNDIYLLPNESSTGTIQFGSAIVLASNETLNTLEAGDINDDGKADIVAVDFFNNKIDLFINESTRAQIAFAAGQVTTLDPFSADITLADYTGNGKLDVIGSTAGSDNMVIFKNNSSAGTLSLVRDVIPQPQRSNYIVSGDLSGDGKPDLAFTARDIGGNNFFVGVLRNTVCNKPVIPVEGTPTICNGQFYLFTTPALPNTNYIWKKDGVEVQNSTDNTYSAGTPGNYTVTAVSGTCSIESPAVTLNSNTDAAPADPTASNNGPTCIGGSITLQATAVTGATYEWLGPNGFSSTEQNPVISDMSPEKAGTYYVKAIIAPCESNVSETIVEVINPPDLSVSKDIEGKVCEGETITLTVGSAAGYTYQWFKDGTPIASATSNSYNATQPGSYKVGLKGVSNNCDLESEAILVEMFPPATANFSSSGTLCEGSVITFTESSTLEPNKTPIFTWNFGDGTTSTEQNPTHTYPAQTTATEYTVQLIIGYEGHTCNSNPATNTLLINQPTAFTIDIDPEDNIPFCDSDSVLLSVSQTGLNSVTWSTGETGFSIYGKEAGTLTATAVNTAGCESTSQLDLTTVPGPNITATTDAEVLNLGETAQLTASGADLYLWSPPETLDDPTSATPVATPTETTTYMVTGTGTNGCSASAEVTIEVRDTGDKLPIEAPRMFSPNNDGVNDTWVIDNIQNFPDCALVVFTRSGKLVFEALGYNNDWDGRDNNQNDLPEGAYFYTISCSDGKNASGSVSIIR